MTKILPPILMLVASVSVAHAEEFDLARDEVATVKKKLVSAQGALGGMPEGYARDTEDFSLPTSFNPAEGGMYYPIGSSVRLRFSSKAVKDGQAAGNKMGDDFQQKYAEAMAKGDYEALAKISEDMQKQGAQVQAQMMEGQKVEPISVSILLNPGSYVEIDPDAVVFEKAGVIALRRKNQGDESKGMVQVFFDPVALKDTKKLSKFQLRAPEKGSSSKLAVYNAQIDFDGPIAAAEGWAKKVDSAAILGLIDGK